jgi:hypothetical protein
MASAKRSDLAAVHNKQKEDAESVMFLAEKS